MRLELPWTWRTWAALSLLAYLVGAAHELTHHFAGFLSSGQFGRMSFNLFAVAETHPHPVLVSLAGPALTYSVAWVGAFLLLLGIRPMVGYSLVVGSVSWMRLVGALGGKGDEAVVARALTGSVPRWTLVAIVSVLVLPPIVIAFRSLSNRVRVLVFLGSFVGAFLPLILVRMADQRWFAANVNAPETFHRAVIAGIPWMVVGIDLLVLFAFLLFGARVLSCPDAVLD